MGFVKGPQQRGLSGWMKSPGLHPWHREHHRHLVLVQSHPCSLGITAVRDWSCSCGECVFPLALSLQSVGRGKTVTQVPLSHCLRTIRARGRARAGWHRRVSRDSRTAPPDWQPPPGRALRWWAGWRRFLSSHFLGRKWAFLIIIAQQLSNHFSTVSK